MVPVLRILTIRDCEAKTVYISGNVFDENNSPKSKLMVTKVLLLLRSEDIDYLTSLYIQSVGFLFTEFWVASVYLHPSEIVMFVKT